MKAKKYMQTLDPTIFVELKALAKKRGITVQEYIRAVVIPTHLQLLSSYLPTLKKKNNKYKLRAKKAWKTRRLKAEAFEAMKDEVTPPEGLNLLVWPSEKSP